MMESSFDISTKAEGLVLSKCANLVTNSDLSPRVLTAFAEKFQLSQSDIALLAHPDPQHPYGRRPLFSNDLLEVMVATWTPGVSCAPHDHGGSFGVVRVLRGRSCHRVWKVEDGELSIHKQEHVGVGGVMVCGSDMVHSMGDDGDDESLITLHLYTRSIFHMVVYDQMNTSTLVVDGQVGAWIPDEPSMIWARREGFVGADSFWDGQPGGVLR